MSKQQSDDQTELPQPTMADHVYEVGKVSIPAAVAMVPGIGPILSPVAVVAAEIVSGWIAKPVEKRREVFLAAWVERTKALEASYADFNASTAFMNEAFVTAFLEALPIAIRTHQEEKREALLNGLSNAALPDAPDENKVLLFLSHIGSFGRWHLKVLDFYANEPEYRRRFADQDHAPKKDGGTRSLMPYELLCVVYPELLDQEALVTMIIGDLSSRGLGAGDWPEPADQVNFRLTKAGREFLDFIERPVGLPKTD